MKLTLAGGALLMMTASAAFAQGTTSTTTSNPNTTNPSTMAPATMAPGNPAPGTSAPVTPGSGATAPNAMRMGTPPARQATNPVVQAPGATVNTTAQSSSSPSPSAVQTHDTTSRTAAAPVPGRNSFTMGQARRRIASAGFTNVKDLKKDDQGIWRGQATKDGASKSVALDYQGNVVGQ